MPAASFFYREIPRKIETSQRVPVVAQGPHGLLTANRNQASSRTANSWRRRVPFDKARSAEARLYSMSFDVVPHALSLNLWFKPIGNGLVAREFSPCQRSAAKVRTTENQRNSQYHPLPCKNKGGSLCGGLCRPIQYLPAGRRDPGRKTGSIEQETFGGLENTVRLQSVILLIQFDGKLLSALANDEQNHLPGILDFNNGPGAHCPCASSFDCLEAIARNHRFHRLSLNSQRRPLAARMTMISPDVPVRPRGSVNRSSKPDDPVSTVSIKRPHNYLLNKESAL
jgi:hypothetical protein